MVPLRSWLSPKAAQRFVEFFTAQINNDHTRKAYLNATRRFAQWCQAHELNAVPSDCNCATSSSNINPP
jgi:hypothetical protein